MFNVKRQNMIDPKPGAYTEICQGGGATFLTLQVGRNQHSWEPLLLLNRWKGWGGA